MSAMSALGPATSSTLIATTSQPRSLLSIAKLNRARSRIRPSTSNRVLIDQTCFGRRGGLARSAPRHAVVGRCAISIGLVVLLCYKDDEHAPRMQAAKSCALSECYGHENACARIGLVVSDPKATWARHTVVQPTRLIQKMV